jgi:hypothetical protein
MTFGSGFQFTWAQRASSVSAVTCVENAGIDAAGIEGTFSVVTVDWNDGTCSAGISTAGDDST